MYVHKGCFTFKKSSELGDLRGEILRVLQLAILSLGLLQLVLLQLVLVKSHVFGGVWNNGYY